MKDWLNKLLAQGLALDKDLGQPQAELGGRLERIRAQLQALAGKQKVPAEAQTIADDGSPLPAAKLAAIGRDEGLVRGTLELFGLNYDSLIAMDGQSAYAQAVQAQPELPKRVLASEQPVLEALKIALGFKPFAEFAQKYGRTPDDIKAAVEREVRAEMAGKVGKKSADVAKVEAPLFSAPVGQRTVPSVRRKNGLREVFGR